MIVYKIHSPNISCINWVQNRLHILRHICIISLAPVLPWLQFWLLAVCKWRRTCLIPSPLFCIRGQIWTVAKPGIGLNSRDRIQVLSGLKDKTRVFWNWIITGKTRWHIHTDWNQILSAYVTSFPDCCGNETSKLKYTPVKYSTHSMELYTV